MIKINKILFFFLLASTVSFSALTLQVPSGLVINFGEIEIGENSWESGYDYGADQMVVTVSATASENFTLSIQADNFVNLADGSIILGASNMQWNTVWAQEGLSVSINQLYYDDIRGALLNPASTSIPFNDGDILQNIYTNNGLYNAVSSGVYSFQFLFGFNPPNNAAPGTYQSAGIMFTLTP